MPLPLDIVGEDIMFSGCPSTAFVCSFIRTDLVATISQNGLSNLIKRPTNIQYPLLITGLDSAGQGYRRPSRWQSHPRQCWGVEVHLVFFDMYPNRVSAVSSLIGNCQDLKLRVHEISHLFQLDRLAHFYRAMLH